MSKESPVISIRNLSFSYGTAPVIENASLDVLQGQVTSFVGPNGGGKTTLLRLILGLEKPDSGCVEVFGCSPEQARSRIGYMPQHVRHDHLFPVTVLEVVMMGRMGAGRFGLGGRDRQKSLEALDKVGLADMAAKQYPTLSGGQRQRVLMARAIASSPELLLMDEPTSMIDAASQNTFTRMIEQIRGECGIVIVSHDLGFVSSIVDQVVLVNRSVRSCCVQNLDSQCFESLYGERLRVFEHGEAGGKEGAL